MGVPGSELLPLSVLTLSFDACRGGNVGLVLDVSPGKIGGLDPGERSSSPDPFVQAFSHSFSGSNPSGYSRLLDLLDNLLSLGWSSPEVTRAKRLPDESEMGRSEAMGDVTPKMSEKPPRSCSVVSGSSSRTGSEGGAGRAGGGAGRAGGSDGRAAKDDYN